MKPRDTEYLVLEFLQKNEKFKGIASTFRNLSGLDKDLDGQSASLNHQDTDHSLQDSLLFYAAERDPQKYVDSFDQLVAFVDASLDLYRPELQRVLYPVFVHVYLQLVSYGASQKAAELLQRYRRRLVEVGGRQSNVRAQELQQLQAVAVAQHLAVNPFAKEARKCKSNLRLCTYSFELLVHYLQANKQWLILSILNKHVAFELHEGRPLLLGVLAGDEEGTGLLQGRAGEAAGAINSTALNLSLLKDSSDESYASQRIQTVEDKITTVVAAASQTAENDMDVDGEQQQASASVKRLKHIKDKVLTGAKEKLKALQDNRRPSALPLLPASDKVVDTAHKDLAARAIVSPNDPPSCCFFTIVNSRHGGVTALTASPDTKHLAAGFSDSVVRVYNLDKMGNARAKLSKLHKRQKGDGLEPAIDVDTELAELQDELADLSEQQVKHLYGHSGSVTGLSYSTDQALLFSSSADGTVRLWSTQWCKNLAAYRGHTFPVWDVAACPHGTYFVSGGADQTARVWSTELARPLRIFNGHQSDVDVVCWHPNSQYVATGSSDRTVRLWDVSNGACVRVLTSQTSCVTCLGFSPDGQQLAAGTEDGTVAVYDLGSARRMALLEGHIGPVWSLSYSRGTGSLLATGGADRTVRLFSCPRGESMVEVINDELAVAEEAVTEHQAKAAAAAAAGAAGSSAGSLLPGQGSSSRRGDRAAAAAAAAAAGGAGAAGGVGAAAGGGGGGAGGAHGHGHAPSWQPYQLLKTFTTQSMPVVYVEFSPRNLLLAGGPWTLQPKVISGGQHAAAGKGR